MKLNKFEVECLKEKQVIKQPGAVKIKTETEKNNKVKLMLSNSDYFMKGAEEILVTKTPSIIFIIGFYAMEHRANALIAKHGFEVKDHKCSEIFLSELGYKSLAESLSKVQSQRLNHYNMNLDEIGNKRAQELFINTINPFINQIDILIKDIK